MKLHRMFLHVVFPIFVGGIIYLLFRSDALRMFRWVEFIGGMPSLSRIRDPNLLNLCFPRFVIYSLPNALWAYSTTTFFILTWRDSKSKVRFFWMTLGASLAILAEIGQILSCVPGTFDIIDVLTCSITTAASACFFLPMKKSILTKQFSKRRQS